MPNDTRSDKGGALLKQCGIILMKNGSQTSKDLLNVLQEESCRTNPEDYFKKLQACVGEFGQCWRITVVIQPNVDFKVYYYTKSGFVPCAGFQVIFAPISHFHELRWLIPGLDLNADTTGSIILRVFIKHRRLGYQVIIRSEHQREWIYSKRTTGLLHYIWSDWFEGDLGDGELRFQGEAARWVSNMKASL